MSTSSRYPNADILAQREHWDPTTRSVVLDRVHNVPAFQFFTPDERATLELLCERLVPQANRAAERRIPIAPWIDERCARAVTDGTRFDDMPPNPVAWRLGLRGLDETGQALSGGRFVELSAGDQERVLRAVDAGDPPGDVWRQLPARKWWVFVALRQVTGVYYAHPTAWDEIGFGGPAYPRGYFALNNGYPEPWEPRETGEEAARSLRPRWRFP